MTDAPAPSGLLAVRVSAENLSALASHLRRRLEARALDVVAVDGRATDDPFRDAVGRLSSGPSSPLDAAAAAQLLSSSLRSSAGAASAKARALLVIEPTRCAWGAAVGVELARLTASEGLGDGLVLWLAASFSGVEVEPFEVGSSLSPEDREIWWRAVADEAASRGRAPAWRGDADVGYGAEGNLGASDRLQESARLQDLERWWSVAMALPAHAEAPPGNLSPSAWGVLRALLVARRAWPLARLQELVGHEVVGASAPRLDAAVEELRRHELVSTDVTGVLAASARALPRMPSLLPADASWAKGVAAALQRSTREGDPSISGDPWSRCRAAEILASLGEIDEAEAVAHGALASLADAPVRDDLWRRWIQALEQAIEGGPAADRAVRLVRSSEVALRVGHVDMALRLARDAATAAPGDHATLLAMGRALAARGDLVGAGVALERALQRASGDLERGAACVELAEVRYGTGDLEGASAWATQAVAAVAPAAVAPGEGGASTAAARSHLGARNVLGKVLLARGAWGEAEVHFAADSIEAACSGDGMAELRAQTNRAIALLSSGRLEEARQMLLAVHDAGERRGELRALTFALANLATLATLQHRYAEALSLSERAFHAYRRLGERVRLAPLATNLAELRLRLGLVDEAEHGLRFGIKACGTDMPAMRLAHFSFVTAQVQLARGRTQAAATELASAMAGMQAGEGAKTWGGPAGLLLSQCHRLAARVALEDGDLRRAQRALDIARNEPPSLFARAEIAILDATVGQASGEPFAELAGRALELAREADDVELLVEAHALVAEASLVGESGAPAPAELDRAMLSLRAARAVRDEVADSLPGVLRTAYLGRRHAPDLERLRLRIEAARPACDSVHVPSTERPTLTPPPGAGSVPPPRPSRAGLTPAAAGVFARIVGHDPAILSLLTAIPKVAASDATILVHGESGTGKELVAEAVHAASSRASGPLVKVNCAALVETLLLSELFGHEKGAFTGAAGRRRGRFEAAEGGTLFLDEIGDISARTQVALLRVLQDKTYERVGGTTPMRANVRIVCATHRDLQGMVARGTFREDLYYRLRGVVLEVPSLRSRIGDLGAIAATLLDRLATERREPAKRLDDRALSALSAHPWPGNVREFENALRAAALFAEGDAISLEDFTDNVQGLGGLKELGSLKAEAGSLDGAPLSGSVTGGGSGGGAGGGAADSMSAPPTVRLTTLVGGDVDSPARATDVAYSAVRGGVSLGEMKRRIERECVARALAESDGNITRAATLLGMKRPRLSQLVKQYGLQAGHDASGGDAGGDLDPDSGRDADSSGSASGNDCGSGELGDLEDV